MLDIIFYIYFIIYILLSGFYCFFYSDNLFLGTVLLFMTLGCLILFIAVVDEEEDTQNKK